MRAFAIVTLKGDRIKQFKIQKLASTRKSEK
jgi:hypothetical protein